MKKRKMKKDEKKKLNEDQRLYERVEALTKTCLEALHLAALAGG